jgi:hypothetical protein
MTDLTKATPRPWRRVEPVALDYGATLIYDSENKSLIAQMCGGGRVRAIDAVEERANAALIVRAVNLHDELVAALRRSQVYLDRIDKQFQPQNDGPCRLLLEFVNSVLTKVDAP